MKILFALFAALTALYAASQERRAPMFRVSAAYPDTVKGHRYNVLQQTDVPAVIVEMFNIRNPQQARYYAQDVHLATFMERIAAGVLTFAVCSSPPITQVVIDDGHGELEPGAFAFFGGKKFAECQYCQRAQMLLTQALNRHVSVQRLTFTKADWLQFADYGIKKARLNFFVEEVNRLAALAPAETVYLSLHVERGMSTKALPTVAYTPYLPENYYRQRASVKLAEEIIAACQQEPWHKQLKLARPPRRSKAAAKPSPRT